MKGAVGSLNAAVAGSILLFEALAQRDPNATPRVQAELPDAAAPARPARKASRGEVTDAGEAPAPTPAKRRAAKTVPAPADTDPATGLADAPAGEATTDPDPEVAAAPRSGRRKVASVDVTDPADALSAPGAASEPVPTEPDPPKRRVRKGLSTQAADPADETPPSPEADLLPTDGARKRARKATATE
jgi:hypothetical protein